ncbi:NEDD8-activating enzyme E1 catalytic subunit, partial [Araneus ventricosus]
KVHSLTFSETDKLQTIVDFLIENADYQMKSPGLTTNVGGKNKTLYMQSVASIEEATRPNLKKTLKGRFISHLLVPVILNIHVLILGVL